MKSRIFLFIFAVLIIFVSGARADKPDWVTKRPISKLYYIGIGIAAKNDQDKEDRGYLQQAKNSALNDIASQIKVSISGEIINKIEEKAGKIASDIKKQIAASTDAELEEVELVDSWESKKEYWIYYRLSKAKLQEKKDNAVQLSLDFYRSAMDNLKSGKVDKALQYLIQAIGPIERYIAEPLEVDYEGNSIYLANDIFYSLNKIISQIELKKENNNQNTKIGQAVKLPLIAEAVYTGDKGEEYPVTNFPINFEFVRGKGELFDKVRTDRIGKAGCKISRISAPDKIQIVSASVNIGEIPGRGELSPITTAILKCMPIPTTKFVINVSGMTAAAKVSEIHFGKKLTLPRIEPLLKNALNDLGFVFVEDASEADIFIELKAESIHGSEKISGSDMYSAFVALNISAIDMSTGDEVYKNMLDRIAGFGLNFDKAGLDAFKNAGEKLRTDLIPNMIKKLTQ